MLYLGTSGFSYDDWVGPFYPAGTPKKDWLIYYAREFDACEINSTYYALPGPKTFISMLKKVKPGFLFVIKAHQKITHERGDNQEIYRGFISILRLLQEAKALGCLLAQFPYSFHYNQQNRDYLLSAVDKLRDFPIAIEFRHKEWLNEEVFDWLRSYNSGLCCVDEPHLPNLLPPMAVITSKTGYVRFHGRNAARWWNHEFAWERYDYTYTDEELKEWVPRIKYMDSMAEKTFVFANNHWKGQAVNTIRQLKRLLE